MSWLFGMNKEGQQGGAQGFEAPQVPTFGETGAGSEDGQDSGSVSGGSDNAGGAAAVSTIGEDVEGYRSQVKIPCSAPFCESATEFHSMKTMVLGDYLQITKNSIYSEVSNKHGVLIMCR